MRVTMKSARWAMINSRKPGAATRLFCFPYAGSGASIFWDWHDYLPEDIEVVRVQLPGRENRFTEPRFSRLSDVIGPLSELIAEMDEKPFYFFGHSVGALIAFELTRALQRHGSKLPFHLVASGMRAPQLPRREEELHYLMDDETLMQKLKEYNGTPGALLQDTELMRFFLPQLRDDFAISETYEHTPGPLLGCPITALGGDKDPNVLESDVASWFTNTKAEFRYLLFAGDHFFIHPNKTAILDLLGRIGSNQTAVRTPMLSIY